ncbi:hypothetical protein SAZ10_33505 [Mesorhizobium sp. BAC0120]|uniref:hypothetical protein n=1 Tax=Mesorhizobium sp. BAC0120 TaxID=3090670 RepID=UPI00298BF927|nr:hypothetical protein [Mesorhizobium sp. BAC0120]MDW6026680.1 hypothetical protein [Mesorhizobium sp. BAC0120]
MSRSIAEHALFKLRPSKAEAKAGVTDHAARTIIDDEAARREAKTARLRRARLENEAKLAAAAAPARFRPIKATSTRRVKSSA